MDTYTYENGNRRVKTAPDGFSRTENPRVGGSIPPLATIITIKIIELQAVSAGSEKSSYRK